MEVAMPMSGSAIDCYEDMFKEITRKLYGEDGLPELNADRLTSTGQDRGLTPIDYEVDTPILKPEEHLTAFGLAALMQNGFPPSGILNSGLQTHKLNTGMVLGSILEDKWITSEENLQWTQSKIATYNPSHKLFRCTECDCVGYLLRVAEHWLGTHSTIRAFHCSQCPYESAWARCVRIHLSRQHNISTDESCDTITKDNPILQEIIKYLQRLKNKLENCGKSSQCAILSHTDEFHSQTVTGNANIPATDNQLGNSTTLSTEQNSSTSKRYSCTFCPYATDRRDLFTRHENIHREEKPFQCYVCQKQFNRADHVKKHFLRMHRDHPYDLNRIRRHPPKNSSGMSYYQKYNNSTTQNQSPDGANSLAVSSLSIPGFNNVSRNLTNSRIQQPDPKIAAKVTNGTKSGGKKKGEKRFSCCYCSWSGVDNWCLKRHMNTHLKPFVCGLCDYKAARSERLATHVLKVHNKRACGKCNYLTDDLAQLSVHQQEQHPLENRNRSGSNNVLRTNTFNGNITASATNPLANNNPSSCSQELLKSHDISTAAVLLQHSNRFLQADPKSWKNHIPKHHGAARLFSYMEASDGSDHDSDPRSTEEVHRGTDLTPDIQSDFPEAGDVGNQVDEENGEEMELPLFVCPTCGCEFEDDLSLETHQYTHRHSATSPAKIDDSKENVDPDLKYRCCLCNATFENQYLIMSHMSTHSSLYSKPVIPSVVRCKRPRKQSRPKKIVLPFWDSDEVEVLRHLNGKLRKWRGTLPTSKNGINKLIDKYMAQLVTRKGLICIWCKNSGLSRYHTKSSLALHYYWRHSKKKYRCEHCDMLFRHRYQCVLHSSRIHTNQRPQLVPTVLPKDTTHLAISAESVCSSQDTNHFFSNSHTVYVPDSTISNAHKLGMSFFDHSFIHSSTAINNHMPIIIPTFPPN
ncbi:hypothetical protein NQ315_015080 [Exocentrus adspersus]|uniref:C2H2-type domain-containing protein n=1 Tax=Exocentrus adspersus TaxID=1586481 RepID=A0AAV8VX28_9CUCU|nr:hypothetical protein NQ315_015080 [Exocentrus adspersus]